MSDRGNSIESVVRGAVARLSQLEEEIRGLNADKSAIYGEVKSKGVEPAAVRDALAFQRNPEKVQQRSAGMIAVLRMLGVNVGDMPPALTSETGDPARISASGTEDATRVHARGGAAE